MNLDNSIRLNKFISDSGHCSRREADRLIEANRVKVNGKLPELGTRVEEGDEVSVDGMQIYSSAANKSDRVYLAYNKPVGITCTTESNVAGNIVDAVDHDERIFPIGRLDKPSEGLILLTSDGDIVNKILRAENAHDKEYLVSVDKPINHEFIDGMSKGVPILGTKTKPCKVIAQGKTAFKIILTEGLNRQIRRMCEHFGYSVKSLQRLRIMHIQLGKLRPGQWRKLTRPELDELKKAVENSSGEAKSRGSRSKARKKPSGRPHYHANQSNDRPANKSGGRGKQGGRSAKPSKGRSKRR